MIPVPTPRLLFLSLCGAVVLPLTGSPALSIWLAAGWTVCVIGLAVMDILVLPGPEQMDWTRYHDNKLSLGTWNSVVVSMRNRSPSDLVFRVRDTLPRNLVPRQETQGGHCAPGDSWSGTYEVFPVHRGDYLLGPLTVRCRGLLGLAWRTYTIAPDGQLKVYPNLIAIRRYETLAARGHLELMGVRTSRQWGEGTELERLREYGQDDEFRRIHWKATARRRRPIVVDFETERSQSIVLMLDVGRLMATTVPNVVIESDGALLEDESGRYALTRLDHAINAALLLSFVAQTQSDRIGLVAFSDHVSRFLPPAGGRRQFLAITDALYDLVPEHVEPDFGEALAYVRRRVPRRSLLVLFTEISEPGGASELVSHSARASQHHLPLVVALRDPGVEAAASQELHSAGSVYERSVAAGLLRERSSILAALQRQGALVLDCKSQELTPALINRYLDIKARSAL